MNAATIIAYEAGELDEQAAIEAFQGMIDDGSVWLLQGSYGRQAMAYIDAGLCALGPRAHHDYYGNRVPGREDVEPGSKGTLEYCRTMQERI